MSLYHSAKPKIWKMDIRFKEDVQTGHYKNGYTFPCKDKCLVCACCNLYCVLVFNYMNHVADYIYEMSADEINTYRTTTPGAIKRKIQEMYTYDKRLAYPETCTVSRDWK